MRNNLLKDVDIKKAVIVYEINNSIVKKTVELRYTDDKECYFVANFMAGFEKPNKKFQAELKIFAPEGVYKTKLTVNSVQVTLKEILFQCSVPKDWEFIQMRRGGRKILNIPFKIEYGDGYVIESKTYDIAVGGFAFITNAEIEPMYRRLPATVTLELNEELSKDLPENQFKAGVVFVREIEAVSEENPSEKRYAYRFANLGSLQQIIVNKLLENNSF